MHVRRCGRLAAVVRAGAVGARVVCLVMPRIVGVRVGMLAARLGLFAARLGLFDRLAARRLVAFVRGFAARAPVAAAAAGTPVDLILGVAMRALFLGDQRLPVGDRDLIIVGMDFRERQEAVAVAAIVDEGGLQRRLYPRDFREIDVAAQLAAVCGFEIEFLDAVAAQNDHPGLLRMGGVDKHFVGHETVSWRRAIAHPRRVASDTRGGKAAPNTGLKGWRRAARAKASAAALPTTLVCSPGRRG